jgi:hypothetical protein
MGDQPVATDNVLSLTAIADGLENAARLGRPVDQPEGVRYIQISDTLSKQFVASLRFHVESIKAVASDRPQPMRADLVLDFGRAGNPAPPASDVGGLVRKGI